MSRMFYSLPEAAAKLGKSEDDVRGMIESGTLQEFRDGEQVMLKVEQVDLLAGDDEGGGEMIPLADSSELEPIGLASSGSASGFSLEDSAADQTGISIFDPEGEEEVDPAAATQVSGSIAPVAEFGSASASGSGLANIAIDSDDTSLGADLLEDVYGGDDGGSGAPADLSAGSAVVDTGGDLFESPTGGGAADEDLAAPAGGLVTAGVLAEPYEPAWSGLLGGVAFAMTLMLLVALAVALLAMTGGAPSFEQVTSSTVMIIAGGGVLLMAISAGIGWVILRKG